MDDLDDQLDLECIFKNIEHPGPLPKKPSKPRKPREFITKTKIIWSSEQDNIPFSELLFMIPHHVTAENIYVVVEKNENGYRHTTISYNYDIPNTKYKEQLLAYQSRVNDYGNALKMYEKDIEIWRQKKQEYDEWEEKTSDLVFRIAKDITISS